MQEVLLSALFLRVAAGGLLKSVWASGCMLDGCFFWTFHVLAYVVKEAFNGWVCSSSWKPFIARFSLAF
ncbi:MAG: hypothetical protein M2R45_04369 [Verrucomicrobia subdivision 3 bacterium]|nr:hypothetical protein [Limisphaerales bacterium]MCS1416074.1 hypothetical protein [Limisphaerales bacterium]